MINPIAFSILGIDVRWYGIIISCGILLSGYIATLNAKADNLSEDSIIDYILLSLPFCVIGARVYYVIFEYSSYKGNILKMLNIREGGLAIHGALIAGVIVAYFYCKKKNISFFRFFDIICVSIPLGQSIGRWGNYTNSEAYGVPTDLPWAINVDGTMVHPTFLYESIWNFALFIFLMYLFRHKKFDGQIISLYFIIYSIGRFFIESLRIDSLMILGLRTAQITSILLMCFGVFIYFVGKNRGRI